MNEAGPSPIAVITGGTSGIGLATARRLLRCGHRVAIFSQREDSVSGAHKLLTKEFGAERTFARTADLAVPAAIDAFFEELRGTWGTPAVLVCNAGISPKGPDGATPFHRIGLAEWNDVLSVNLTGAMLCCQVVLPAMIRSAFGRIVLIGSVAARTRPRIAGASYVTSKAALSGLTKSLVSACAGHGVTVNLVAPGRIVTNMTGPSDSAANQAALTTIPAGRLGDADDVAAVVEFLVSEAAGFVNGAIIDVNGGEFVPA
jgi:3-oxoacyl-[acyl-carrier protein] reductase